MVPRTVVVQGNDLPCIHGQTVKQPQEVQCMKTDPCRLQSCLLKQIFILLDHRAMHQGYQQASTAVRLAFQQVKIKLQQFRFHAQPLGQFPAEHAGCLVTGFPWLIKACQQQETGIVGQ
jgi:hypothetical protein